MTGNSKRNLLSIVAIIALVTLAGCVGPIDDPTGLLGGDDVDGEKPMDAVPAESNVVMKFDPIGLAQDPTTTEIGNHVTQDVLEQEDSYEDQLDDAFEQFNTELNNSLSEEDLELDIQAQDLGEVILFGDTEQIDESYSSQVPSATGASTGSIQQTPDAESQNVSDQYVGFIVELDLSEEELANIFDGIESEAPEESDVNFTQEQYNGLPIYTITEDGEEFSFAILESGTHVMGPRHVVEDAIDTYVGDKDGVDESIIPEESENTYMSIGTTDVNETMTGASDQIENLDEDPTVESVLMTYSTNGDDTINLDMDMTLDSAQAPFQIQLRIEDQLEQMRESGGDDQPQNPTFEMIKPLVEEDNINVNSESDTLSLEYQATTEEIKNFIDEANESGFGAPTGPTQPPTQPPTDDEMEEPTEEDPQMDQSMGIEHETVTLDNGSKELQIEVLEDKSFDNMRVRTDSLERSFEQVQVGDEYSVAVEGGDSVQIYGDDELLDYVIIRP